MTLTTQHNKSTAVADGVTATFLYDFRCDLQSDMQVYLNDILQPQTFTVTGLGNDAGGTVVLPAVPTSGVSVVMLRSVPLTQLSSYEGRKAFPSATHENIMDRLTMMAQQLSEQINRTISFPPSSGGGNLTIPGVDEGKCWVWEAGGSLRNSTYDIDTQQAAAETAATNAATSATNAATSATSAATSASNAAASAAAAAAFQGEYIILEGQRAAGVNDGGAVSGAAGNARRINEKVLDPAGRVTLDPGFLFFTLASGTYRFRVRAPAHRVGYHRVTFTNVTDAVNFVGADARTDSTNFVTTVSEVSGEFTIGSAKDFEVNTRVDVTRSGDGLGIAVPSWGDVAHYTKVELWKVG